MKDWHLLQGKFELGYGFAFVGRFDGVIDLIDLAQEALRFKYLREQHITISYEEVSSSWDREKDWEASFSNTDLNEIEDRENGECAWMEKGAYERLFMQSARDNHFAIQNRKQLIGHTAETTALHAYGDCLLSCSRDGTIKLWSYTSYSCLYSIDTGFKMGCSILQKAGPYIFGLEKEQKKVICQRKAASNQRVCSFELPNECVSFSLTGNMLFCLTNQSDKDAIEIYDLSTKEHIRTLMCPSKRWDASFSWRTNTYTIWIVNRSSPGVSYLFSDGAPLSPLSKKQ